MLTTRGPRSAWARATPLLVAAVDDELYYVATGNDFSTILTSSVTSRLDGMLSSNFGAQRFEEGVLSFFAEMNQVYIDNFGLGNAGGGGSYQVNERTMGGDLPAGPSGGGPDGALRHRPGALQQLPGTFLWGGLPTLCVPAYPLLAWSGIRLVPAPLAPSSAATARRSERAQRTR